MNAPLRGHTFSRDHGLALPPGALLSSIIDYADKSPSIVGQVLDCVFGSFHDLPAGAWLEERRGSR